MLRLMMKCLRFVLIKISRILRLNVCVGPGNIMDTLLKGKACLELTMHASSDYRRKRLEVAQMVA